MTKHPIPCPHCGHTFQVEAAHNGRRARCGHCRGSFVIDCRPPDSGPPAQPDDSARRRVLDSQVREAEDELQSTRQELAKAHEQLRAARLEVNACRAEAVAAHAEGDAAQGEEITVRARADSARADAESARAAAQAARAEAASARAQAEQSAARTRESAARLSEQAVLIETNRQRLAMLEEQVRLEQVAAEDAESRVAAAKRALTDTERLLSEVRDALAGAERERAATAQAQAALAGQCELLRVEETRLRVTLVELEAQVGRLSGERVAAEPRFVPASTGLLLPDVEAPDGAPRPADWLGGLRGLHLDSEHGREFIERLAPLLDRHPDRRDLDEWARQGRTVFLLCNTPGEAGRLKQLIDVWGEVDPDGIAAIAPAFHGTTTFFAAPPRVIRARQAVKLKLQAAGRRHAAGRRRR